MVDETSPAVVLKPDKTSSLLVCSVKCFSPMLISNVHKSIIVMNSLETHFSRNVFEAIQKTHSMCFIGSKTTWLHLVVLNPNKTLHYIILLSCYGLRLEVFRIVFSFFLLNPPSQIIL